MVSYSSVDRILQDLVCILNNTINHFYTSSEYQPIRVLYLQAYIA